MLRFFPAASTFFAIPTLVFAWVYGAYFFKTRERKYGLLNDIFSAVVLVLLIFPTLEIHRLVPLGSNWFTILTWAAVAGMIVGAGGQLLLVAGKVSLETSFVTGGLGIVPILVWFFSVTVQTLQGHMLNPLLGWLSLGVLGCVALITTAAIFKKNFLAGSLSLLLVVTLGFWLLLLGLFLLPR